MPRVSVIMPCHNHGQYVTESVKAVLAQSEGDLELIVIDDGSRDSSREVLAKLAQADGRVRVVSHESNLGASRSRNDGLQSALGEFVAFCDADDVWYPRKLERQMQLLRLRPDCDIAFSDAEIIDEHGNPTGRLFSQSFPVPEQGSGNLFRHLCTRNFINMQTGLVRRASLRDVRGFDENIRWVEDWWFWLSLSHRHTFVYTHEPLAKYRVHPGSTSLTKRRSYIVNRVKVFRRLLLTFGDLPKGVEADVFYHLGVALRVLAKYRLSQRCFARALAGNPAHIRAWARWLLSFRRRRLATSAV